MPEVNPVPNQNSPLWDDVILDMKNRDLTGRKKHGTPLQLGNGRSFMRDAYEELLDLAVYMKGAMLDRSYLEGRVKELEFSLESFRKGQHQLNERIRHLHEALDKAYRKINEQAKEDGTAEKEVTRLKDVVRRMADTFKRRYGVWYGDLEVKMEALAAEALGPDNGPDEAQPPGPQGPEAKPEVPAVPLKGC